ncbi:MAG: type VI secretion system-associated FHA domain protein TagH [Woeseia sp.]
MPLQLKITSEHQRLMADDAVRQFNETGGTIGRGLQSDWILPDNDRFVSSRHAAIDYKNGAYYVADISTNGLFVNDSDEPLGKGNPRRLFSGDRLRMGEFEMLVSIDEGESLVLAMEPDHQVVAEHIDQLVPEEPMRTGIQMLDEEEITGDDAFQSALFGTTRMERERPRVTTSPAKPAARKKPTVNNKAVANDDLFAAFLQGAGIDKDDIHASMDPQEIMRTAGQVLREFVSGTSELLDSRSNLKSMFRLDQTTVLPRHNNPLKLAENCNDSVKQLLVGKEGEYLGPIDSVKEVCRDLKFHQDAVIEAMVTSFKEFADRFDPDELQDNFDRTLGRKPLLGTFGKPKYWQLYCELYPIITKSGSGPFPQHIAEEFVRSYEKHIGEYKRVDRKDGKAA